MVYPRVQECIDNNDIKGLHYIFLDALDVDPTFEKYREDYRVCSSLAGFWEPHLEGNGLMPLTTDHEQWTMDYWLRLKRDVMRNFSEKRYSHMILAAKVIFAEKIERLRRERQKAASPHGNSSRPLNAKRDNTLGSAQEQMEAIDAGNEYAKTQMLLDEQRIAERRKALEEENRRFEEDRLRTARAREQEKRRVEEEARRAEEDNLFKRGTKLAIGVASFISYVLFRKKS